MNPLKKNKPAVTQPESQQPRPKQQMQQPEGWGLPFVMALFVHAILFVGLFVVFQWNTESTEVVYAELWSPTQLANVAPNAPTPKEPQPVKEEPIKEESEPEPEPQPAPPPKAEQPKEAQPDENTIEQQQEEQKKLEEQTKLEEQKRLQEEQRLQEQKRLEEEKRQAEEKKRQEEAQQRRREQAKRLAQQMQREQMKELQASSQQNVAGVTVQAGGPQSALYSSRIIACIRPNIAFAVSANMKPGQYKAVYEVHLLNDGRQAGAPKLLKPSGLPAFDSAVERAIRACDPFPNHPTGNPPRTIQLTFDPVDSKR